ncbi:MAG: septation protein IspZ [Maricaulaceae bacterium]|nr:septation protein IspZ [Maricaulaceae bacterium]
MASAASTAKQGGTLLVDVGPTIVFILAYNGGRALFGADAIFWATGAFMVAVTVAFLYAWRVQRRMPPMLMVTAVVVLTFGALTIWLQDPIFAYIKPTIINLMFAYAILISYAFGFNVWKALFGGVFDVPERIWTIFAIRWAVFFQFLAFLNELLWRQIGDAGVSEASRWFTEFTITESFWANFKFFGVMPLTFLFALANIPLLMKHQPPEPEKNPAP